MAAGLTTGSRVVAIVGPTAVGKSAAGVAVARELGGEVVNADSMQLYRGMDIGTAKATADERAGIAHHLLDVWELTEPASVAAYQRLARDAMGEIQGRGAVPVLVGGSGLYVRGALDALDFPGTSADVRAELEAMLASTGPAELHARLRALDPAAATAIPATNGRRIVRALEVIEITGRPFSASPGMTSVPALFDAVLVGLAPPDRDWLDARIAARVDRMWAAGLVEEVRRLVERGLRSGRTARQALGYRQVLAVLDGEIDEATARAQTVQATRRFARRQLSWWRRDPRVVWVDASLGTAAVLGSVKRAWGTN